MKSQGRALGVIVVAACLASLGGAGPVRSLETWLTPLLLPLDRAVVRFGPAVDPEPLALLREPAKAAWDGWCRAVLGETASSAPGRESLLVPVVARREAEHEIDLAVPPAAVHEGAIVTHRGALLGVVSGLSEAGDVATVALLGHHAARPVAAEWELGEPGHGVQFLLAPGGRGDDGWSLKVEARSSSALPPPEQLVHTRDVRALGDMLPAGLLVGRMRGGSTEAPGGGNWYDAADTLRVLPLLDGTTLAVVTVEVEPGASLPLRRGEARLYGSCRPGEAARLAAGSSRGLKCGDWVCQAGLFVGIVETVTPWSSVLDVRPPATPLLVVAPDGSAMATGQARGRWPAGWEPQRGDLVATGHLGAGGLVVGMVGELDDEGFEIERLAPDPRLPVTVVGP
jgi:hypothetical protein